MITTKSLRVIAGTAQRAVLGGCLLKGGTRPYRSTSGSGPHTLTSPQSSSVSCLTHPRGGGGGWGKLHLRLELLGTSCAARAGRSALATAPLGLRTIPALSSTGAWHAIRQLNAALRAPSKAAMALPWAPLFWGRWPCPCTRMYGWAQRRQSQCHRALAG